MRFFAISCHLQGFNPEDNVTAGLQMIVHPEERVADFAKAGSDIISVHAEPAATVHLDRTINQVRLALYIVWFAVPSAL